jgi:hypothetical protein
MYAFEIHNFLQYASQTFSQHFLGRYGGALYTLVICLSCMGTLNIKFYTAGRLTQAATELHFLPPILRTVARVKPEDQDGVPVEEPPRRTLDFLLHPTRFSDGSIPLLDPKSPLSHRNLTN